MIASRDSAAYTHYEERFLPEKQDPKTQQLHEVSAPRRKRNKLRPGVLASMIVLAMTAVYILFCQMQLTQLTAQVTSQTEKLDDLTAESVSLSSKQKYSMDMDQIETYASEQLGMVKMDNSQIEYVELTNPDSITVASSSMSLDALFSGLARSFSAVVEYIR